MSALFRLGQAVILLVGIALAGFVLVKGSQPVDMLGSDPNSQIAGLHEANYWEFMAASLAASQQTPVKCHMAVCGGGLPADVHRVADVHGGLRTCS